MDILNRHHFQGRTLPAASVYVGRGTPLGNPFVLGEHGDGDAVIALYQTWLHERIATQDPIILAALGRLRSAEALVCSCAPARCHAECIRDVLEYIKAQGGLRSLYACPTHEDGTLSLNGEIFVFGSNLAGRHGAGAARVARERFGAIPGRGIGRMGQSYALPTKDADLNVLPLEVIEEHIRSFVEQICRASCASTRSVMRQSSGSPSLRGSSWFSI
ncbi:A1S_2505 family phage non-structural protein [Allochromatium humboldtianum]|uniref:A1S_2505 family phage non-structural protein n=1 Tax=Allochromatium humboldtianum TaxID=504901 RepID=UPI001CA43A53|nr:DUF4326 domain-containing protein [Allochromatium humboldtianum]